MTNFKPLFIAFILFTLLPAARLRAAFSFDVESGAVWNTSNNVQIPSSTGTRFSLTDELKSDPAAFVRFRGTWQINDRHSLSVLYAPLRVDSSGELFGDTSFAGSLFRGGVPTEGDYRFDSYRLTYRYNFVRTENVTFGLGLTANVRDAEIGLSQRGVSAYDDNTGIVPLVNFHLEWKVAPRWSFLTEGDALFSGRGRLEDVLVALQWRASESLALRLGYRLLEGGTDGDTVYNFAFFNYLSAGLTWRF